jgi:hypothetical protein
MDFINQAVIDKLTKRQSQGFVKYGTTMDRDDLTEVEWLVHAQEEAMDLAVYLEKLIQMKSGTEKKLPPPAAKVLTGSDPMPFGKFKGQPLEDLSSWYIKWLLDNATNMDADLRLYFQDRMDNK